MMPTTAHKKQIFKKRQKVCFFRKLPKHLVQILQLIRNFIKKTINTISASPHKQFLKTLKITKIFFFYLSQEANSWNQECSIGFFYFGKLSREGLKGTFSFKTQKNKILTLLQSNEDMVSFHETEIYLQYIVAFLSGTRSQL